MKRIAEEIGGKVMGQSCNATEGELVDEFYRDCLREGKANIFFRRAPAKRRQLWDDLGMTPRGVDSKSGEMMHSGARSSKKGVVG